jgi:hypothetical protein
MSLLAAHPSSELLGYFQPSAERGLSDRTEKRSGATGSVDYGSSLSACDTSNNHDVRT